MKRGVRKLSRSRRLSSQVKAQQTAAEDSAASSSPKGSPSQQQGQHSEEQVKLVQEPRQQQEEVVRKVVVHGDEVQHGGVGLQQRGPGQPLAAASRNRHHSSRP